jgi:hypothetical protein
VAAGLSLDDICAETKISPRVLQALETGKFQFLPERVFCRNFVRQYGDTIGCDQNRLVELFDSAWECHQLTSGTQPGAVVVEAPPAEPFQWRFWVPIAAGALILAVVALVILTGSDPGQQFAPDPRRSRSVSSEPLRAPDGASLVPSAVPVQRVSRPEPDLINLTVRVEEGKECWIQYRDREGVTGEYLLGGGEEFGLELKGPVKFTVGNAGAVSIVVGGQEYSELGVPGQVVHTEVSREGLIPLGSGAQYD